MAGRDALAFIKIDSHEFKMNLIHPVKKHEVLHFETKTRVVRMELGVCFQ